MTLNINIRRKFLPETNIFLLLSGIFQGHFSLITVDFLKSTRQSIMSLYRQRNLIHWQKADQYNLMGEKMQREEIFSQQNNNYYDERSLIAFYEEPVLDAKSSSSSFYEDEDQLAESQIDLPRAPVIKATAPDSTKSQGGSKRSSIHSEIGKITFPYIIGGVRDLLVQGILKSSLELENNEIQELYTNTHNIIDSYNQFSENETDGRDLRNTDVLRNMEKEFEPLTPRRHSPQSVNLALQAVCQHLSSETIASKNYSERIDSFEEEFNSQLHTLIKSEETNKNADLITQHIEEMNSDQEKEKEKELKLMSNTPMMFVSKRLTTGTLSTKKKTRKKNFFAKLFNRHSENSLQMKSGSHNEVTQQIIDDFNTFKANRFSSLIITVPPETQVPTIKSYRQSLIQGNAPAQKTRCVIDCASPYSFEESLRISKYERKERLFSELDECLEALAMQVDQNSGLYSKMNGRARVIYEQYCEEIGDNPYKYF